MSRSPSTAARVERGDVMLIVIWLMVIVLVFGLAIGLVALSASNTTSYNVRLNRAQQAADAGVQAALYRQSENDPGDAGSAFDLNGGLLGSTFNDCVSATFNSSLQITGLATASATGNYGCPSGGNSGLGGSGRADPVGNHAYAQEEYFPSPTDVLGGASPVELQPRIVSLGIDEQKGGYVYSREEAILDPITPLPVLGGDDNIQVSAPTLSTGSLSGTVLGQLESDLGLSSTSLVSTINGDILATNNVTLPSVDASLNLTLQNAGTGSTADNNLGGLIELGGTLSPANAITTAQVIQQPPPPQQPISVSASTPSCPIDPSTDCGLGTYGSGSTFYDPTTDSVTVPAGQTMSIPGGVYVFCNFDAAGGVTANPGSSTPVEIFIDNPNSSRCDGNPPLTSSNDSTFNHSEDSYGNLVAMQGIACTTCLATPSQLQVYVVGDDPQASDPYDDQTYAEIGNPQVTGGNYGGLISTSGDQSTQAMVLYAPTSEVSLTTVHCATTSLLGISYTLCVPGTFEGNLVGDDVQATAMVFQQDLDLGNFALYSGIDLYHVRRYIECSPVASLTGNETTDTSGC
jgi:hypothetical protein